MKINYRKMNNGDDVIKIIDLRFAVIVSIQSAVFFVINATNNPNVCADIIKSSKEITKEDYDFMFMKAMDVITNYNKLETEAA